MNWPSLPALAFCAFCFVHDLAGAPSFPLQPGERLSYRVSWAIVPGAGEIKIEAANEKNSAVPQLRVITTTNTRRLAKVLLPFKAKAESLFDLQTGRLVSLHETSTSRGKESEHRVTFDYPAREARYDSVVKAEPVRNLPMPAGEPSDLIMALMQTRSWALQPGESRDSLVLFDDDFYELTIHALRYEDVRTSLGSFRTLVLEPRMEKTPPKGMFKRGSTVQVWIAQTDHRLPVKFQVDFKIGTGVAVLESYEMPTPSTAPADAKNPRP